MKVLRKLTAALTTFMLLSGLASSAWAAADYHMRFVSKGLKRANSTPAVPGTPGAPGGGQTSPGSGTAPPVTEPVQQLVDVTGSVKASSGGVAYNRVTGVYSGDVTITNQSSQVIKGPIHLVLVNLAASVTLLGSNGVYNGAPYQSYSGSLAPGEAIVLKTSYTNPDKVVLYYTSKVMSGPM